MDVLDAYYVFVYLFIYATQVDSWELWNSFRMLCEHHSQLSIALDVLWVKSLWSVVFLSSYFSGCWTRLPVFVLSIYFICLFIRSSLPSANSLGRWFGESVRAAIINTDVIISLRFIMVSLKDYAYCLLLHMQWCCCLASLF